MGGATVSHAHQADPVLHLLQSTPLVGTYGILLVGGGERSEVREGGERRRGRGK